MPKQLVCAEGILHHTFSDGSGTVLFNVENGETIGLECHIDELLSLDISDKKELEQLQQTLLNKSFLTTLYD